MALQLLGSDKIARFNDSPLLGLAQSIDWTSNLNGQDVFELGQTAKVGTSFELETTGTMEFQSSGGLADLLSRMIIKRSAGAFQGFQYDAVVYSGTAAASTTTTLIKGSGMTPSAYNGFKVVILSGGGAGNTALITTNNATDINLATAITGLASGSTYQIIKGNAQTWTQADMVDMIFNLVIHEKADQATYNRAMVFPRCFPTSVSGRYDANGNATESVAFTGDFAVGATSPYHDIRVVPATRAGNLTATLIPFDAQPILSATWTPMYLYVDNKRLRNSTTSDATKFSISGTNAITITTTEGYAIPSTASIFLVMYRTTPSTTFPSISSGDRATSLTFVRGNQVDIFVAPATLGSEAESEKWLRVQSLDFNVDFRVEPLREIQYNDAGTSVYARVPTLPFNITMNLSAFEDQWLDWKAMLSKTFPGNNVYQDTYDFAPANIKNSFAVVVKTYNTSKSLVQTIRFTDARIDSHGRRIQAGGRSEMSWALMGTAWTVLGSNV